MNHFLFLFEMAMALRYGALSAEFDLDNLRIKK